MAKFIAEKPEVWFEDIGEDIATVAENVTPAPSSSS